LATASQDRFTIKTITTVYLMRAKSSGAISKAGIPRVGLGFSKRYGYLAHHCSKGDLRLQIWQALEFGEIQQMADRAGLFKSVNHL